MDEYIKFDSQPTPQGSQIGHLKIVNSVICAYTTFDIIALSYKCNLSLRRRDVDMTSLRNGRVLIAIG